jgi:molybdate transport system permease protein
MFIASHFYIKSASLGFPIIDKQLIQAAELDGASRWQIFVIFSSPFPANSDERKRDDLGKSMGEFGATIIFAGNFPGEPRHAPGGLHRF